MLKKKIQEIKKSMEDNLHWDSRIDASKIDIEVSNSGKVTVRGTVPSYASVIAINKNIRTVPEATSVNNQLTIEYPKTKPIPEDEEIKESIKNILAWDTEIDSANIVVNVDTGVVTLSGEVDKYWKLFHIENQANIRGITKIINQLAIVPTENITDKEIANDIVNALSRSFYVDIDDVNIKVENGKVILRGKVPTIVAYNAAESSVLYTEGVTGLDNKLIVNE